VLDNQLRVPLWIDELGILSAQIRFGDPTGLRAAASNVDPDAFLDRELQQVSQRRDGDADDRIAHLVLQDDRRIRHQGDADLMARFNGSFGHVKWQRGSRRVVRAMSSSQKKFGYSVRSSEVALDSHASDASRLQADRFAPITPHRRAGFSFDVDSKQSNRSVIRTSVPASAKAATSSASGRAPAIQPVHDPRVLTFEAEFRPKRTPGGQQRVRAGRLIAVRGGPAAIDRRLRDRDARARRRPVRPRPTFGDAFPERSLSRRS